MKKSILFLAALCMGIFSLMAQNWASDVAPILYQKCVKCHNSEGIGPFPLITYDDAFNFRAAIKESVMMKTMPPWPPQEGYGTFAHPRSLTAQQIQAIADWVDAGAPQGNLADAPTPPVITNNYEIQNPDLIIRMPAYTVNTNTDLYRCFVIPTGLTQNKYIQELEVVPGNRAIVHHALVFQDPAQTPVNLDAQDPEPGYTSFGGTGSNTSKLIGAWVPGSMRFRAPQGMGMKLDAGTNIVMQLHYPGGTFNQTDSTEVRIKYATAANPREVTIAPAINHVTTLTNGPLMIPANQTKTFHAQYTIPAQYTISALLSGPHMHLIGRNIKSWGVTTSGDTIPFINIPHWDFHWQGFYQFKNLVKIPGGTTIHATALYDNTTGNPHNPSNPPQTVTAGEATTDEMMMVYFGYTLYMPGDEQISQEFDEPVNPTDIPEGIVQTMQFYDLFPNPSSEQVQVSGFLPTAASMNVTLTDMQGRTLSQETGKYLPAGHFSFSVPLNTLPTGSYFLQLSDGKTSRTKTVIKN